MTTATHPTNVSYRPWLVGVLLIVLTALALHLQGRIGWCACGRYYPWTPDAWSSHTSQHLLDPYSFSHAIHGMLFFALLWWGWLRERLSVSWRMCIAIAFEAGWELLENSPIIINRYRAATASLDYFGDSVANSTGDILSCVLGFWIARWLGLWKTIALIALMELATLLTIRDNLTLNVLMLVHPFEAIKHWQMAGH